MNSLVPASYEYLRARWNAKMHPQITARAWRLRSDRTKQISCVVQSISGRPVLVAPQANANECAYCGKGIYSQQQLTFISSPFDMPRVLICEECVDVCASIIQDKRDEL